MALLKRALGAMKQGLTPEKAALGLAVGAAIGVFPVLGTTTLLCVALCTALGLNHAVVQAANYAVSLIYFPAFYGLLRLGEAVLGAQPLPLSPAALAERLVDDPAALLSSFGAAGVYALVGWVLAAPLLGGTVYAVGVHVLRAAASRPRRPRTEHSATWLWRRRGALGAALLLAAMGATTQAADLVGNAYDEEGRLVYQERHEYAYQDGRKVVAQTTYLGPDDQPIARMEARYGDDPGAPDYRLQDLRFGWELLAERKGDRVLLVRRDRDGEKSKLVRVKKGRDLVIGPGFNDYIAFRWDELLAGETVRCQFAAPNRLQLVGFRIDRVDEAETPGGVRFRIRIDNALLRLFVPSLEVEYDGSTKRLRAYSGVSNVTDDSDDGQKVRIVFLPPSPKRATVDRTSVADGSLAQSGPASASAGSGGSR